MIVEEVDGDLLDQPVDAIVNAWNRNIIPWWLLIPQGVSGALERRGGTAPFREVGRHGAMPIGSAVVTGAGRLPHRAIIHVAGIDMMWTATEASIRGSIRSAIEQAVRHGFESIAVPAIGAGSGRFDEARSFALMKDELQKLDYAGRVVLVRFGPVSRRERGTMREMLAPLLPLGAYAVYAGVATWAPGALSVAIVTLVGACALGLVALGAALSRDRGSLAVRAASQVAVSLTLVVVGLGEVGAVLGWPGRQKTHRWEEAPLFALGGVLLLYVASFGLIALGLGVHRAVVRWKRGGGRGVR